MDPGGGNEKFIVTSERVEAWVERFYERQPSVVTVPIGHDGWQDGLRNTGYVRDMEFDGKTLWGFIEFTNPEAEELAAQGSIPAVSIAIDPEYVDTKTGENLGEVIYHVALTQSPWIDGMAGFQEMSKTFGDHKMFSRTPEKKPKKKSQDGGGDDNDNDTERERKENAMTAELEKSLGKSQERVTTLEKEVADRKGNETKLEKELADAKAEQRKQQEATDRAFAKSLVSGGIDGAKFGLPGETTEDDLVVLLQNTDVKDTIELERKEGKVKLSARKLLGDLLENIVKSGLVELKDQTKAGDEKPGDGEEGKDFSKRQQERKGINQSDKK